MCALPIIGALALTGCDVALAVVDDAVRNQAEQTIVTAQPVASCVVDNATTSEILSVAGDGVTGIDQGTITTVLDVLKRKETINCVVNNGIGGLF